MAGVLLLHGFTSHPLLTMAPLAKVLRSAGYQVAQPTLPGHGTKPQDLRGVRWQDWRRVALEHYRALNPPRAVAGLSMGALLAAMLAAEEETRALVALSPALSLADRRAYLAPYLYRLMPTAKGTKSVRNSQHRKNSPNYPYFPTVALVQLLKLMRRTPEALGKVTVPALVLRAAHDSTVPEAATKRYYDLLRGPKDYKVYADSEHDLLLDAEADTVAAEVRDWLATVMPPTPAAQPDRGTPLPQ